MKLSKLASAMPFAHFLGLPAASAASEQEQDDDECEQRADESDEDYAKRMEELDEKEKAEEERRKEEANRAKGEGDDDDGADMEDGDEEDKKDDKEEGKRAGRAKGARQRERIRCARIIAAGIKSGRINQAAAFAFDTSLTAAQAIAALSASELDKPRGRAGLGERMAGVKVPNVGANGGAQALDPNDPAVKAAAIVAAGKKRRGEV
ncbi:hypothetical protein [Cupriavidus sp. UBA2534]|uniref:hypothetical protein n=1 Tax=Cupriavidus sp. UBA2534 TaxID=1946399 RepID=UPI000E93B1AF|nr:hypothetical protein [Cupriavidus sp. UBA2534]HBO83310.1 hypothetical protein [Cupriavidus sp.]